MADTVIVMVQNGTETTFKTRWKYQLIITVDGRNPAPSEMYKTMQLEG